MSNRIINVGSLELNEGYFLLNEGYFLWKRAKSKPFEGRLGKEQDPYRHCYTYRNSPPVIKEHLLKMLQNAKKKIFIASFLIGDKDLMDALYEAVNRLHGGVYVITALNEKDLEKGLTEIEDAAGVDIQAQKKQFSEMTWRGIYVRGHGTCHAKFVVVDDEIALVSSANLTTSALEDNPKRGATGESGAVITDRAEVERLARFFTRLWYNGCEWEVPPGESYIVTTRSLTRCPCKVSPPTIDNRCGVIWTHVHKNINEQFILETIHDILKRARKNVVLSTYSLCGMTEQPEILLDPLREAMEQKKLNVRLLVRPRNHFEKDRRDAEAMVELGVRIYADSLNHAKGIIADGRFGALFSANFDDEHGLINGVEVGVRLDGQRALKDALGYFEHAMKYADRQYVLRPTQRQMDKSLGAWWQKPWPLLNETVKLKSSEEEWKAFQAATRTPPVLFTREPDGTMHLYAGTGRWKLNISPKDRCCELVAVEDDNIASTKTARELLHEWWRQKWHRHDRGDLWQGFCPAVFKRVRSS